MYISEYVPCKLFGKMFVYAQAQDKGATPLLSGIVLGSYEFTMIFAAPIMGNFVSDLQDYIH